jgi:hypothetical protein
LNSALNVLIWQKIVVKKFGQFHLAKSGQTLEKDSEPRGLLFSSNKNAFLKLD